MTDNDPALDPASWLAKDREYAARAASLYAANKTALFDALARHAITTVAVAFDGYGDSGQIESVDVQAGDNAGQLPPDEIVLQRVTWGSSEVAAATLSTQEAVETLVYDLLEETHGGWENNDGAYGTFLFDTAARTITLEYNERHMESDYSEHQF